MTAGLEGLAVAQWVHTRLLNDPQLQAMVGGRSALEARLWDEPPPRDLEPWWIEQNVIPPRVIAGADATPIMADVAVQVKVVGKGDSYGPLAEPFQRIHALLETRVENVVGHGVVLTSRRVSGVQYPDRANGIEYRHLGGLYETRTQ